MTPLKQGEFVGALDCGTTSVRFIIFDEHANIIALDQIEFEQFYPHPGWHEQDANEIIRVTEECIDKAVATLEKSGWSKDSIKAVGITNQRETTVAWDRGTGQPLCRAIVWDDGRTRGIVTHYEAKLAEQGVVIDEEDLEDVAQKVVSGKGNRLKGEEAKDALLKLSGLPLSTYFSAIKLRWMIDHHDNVRQAHDKDNLLFGTVDSWILYNLSSKLHVIDPSNASRTLLLNLRTLKWSPTLLNFFSLRPSILPKLVSSSEPYGAFERSTLKGIQIAGIIGDQQGALVGNKCLTESQAKCTFGTGAFMLYCTGNKVVRSQHGLISTVAYQAGPQSKPVYALEGSISTAGSAIKWLRDGLSLISSSSEINDLASKEPDAGGLYFVTAFSGLLAPYWDSSASGLMIGLSSYTNRSHIARATLEAAAFQARAIMERMELDAQDAHIASQPESEEGTSQPRVDEIKKAPKLKVDGGMTNGDLAMQILADLTGKEIVRPEMRESTALGAALLAGSALKLFGWDLNDPSTLAHVNEAGSTTFKPSIEEKERERRWKGWERAVQRAKAWRVNEDGDE